MSALKRQPALTLIYGLFLILALSISSKPSLAAPPGSAGSNTLVPTAADGYGWTTVSATLNRQITSAQNRLKYIYGQLNRTDIALGNETLSSLSDQIDEISGIAQSIQTQAASYQTVYQSYLEIIGAKVDGESATIVSQRSRLEAVLQDIKSTVTQGKLLGLQAKQVQLEVQRRGTVSQQALLSERIASPLSLGFWRDLADEGPDLALTFAPPVNNGYAGVLYNWPATLFSLIGVFVLTALLARPTFWLFRQAEGNIVRRFTGDVLPENHISFIPVALSGLICGIIMFVVWEIISNVFSLDVGRSPVFAHGIAGIMPLCGFILGAGLPALSRATAVDGAAQRSARALWGVDWCVSIFVLLQTLFVIVGFENAFPVTARRLIEAIFTLLVEILFVWMCKRLTQRTDARLAPAIYGIGWLLLVISSAAIALGYLAFAFALAVWAIALSVSFASLMLLSIAMKEFTSRTFSVGSLISRRLSHLGVHSNRVAQFGVLLSGIVNIGLIIIFAAICLSDGSLCIPVVADRVQSLFVGQTINGVQFSLNTAVYCIIILIIAYYAIGAFTQWLERRLFPTTNLDIGARTSILNIFNYVAWIAVLLLVLSEAGVTVKNLTWVVSALSVGIGFGLQAIVQNFVSGVILLAERPIRVGDLIELGGIKGDVKRISVRSTEIGLGDGSTMIVPNSQFITSAVRNATLGTSLSAASATVTISPRADATKAQLALMDMMTKRQDILQNPPPGVAISAITETGITLALSAKVSSVRDVGGVTNAIMLDAYRVLQEAGLELGKPS
ncbi:mechanosensitive ion channel [Asaia siamensis]|uniref:Mechanosensitive ion channel protein MscS n=1 Tax=Asaia siamensis TaxID=110479 RepID=A0ABQ1M554_9PROT|nr:mechanosensitive ion channel domain-containing protein [Asaia siamensis]GBR10367.1 mechanosensitive ion channel MscS [Asaia siamensis NRIC 0323]GGC33311.1 mechanosensitive ion channel protein MscS [Asaia siamensis]